MAGVLKEKDALQWAYRGEGAVNLILAYSGNSPDFVGKLLRVQKIPRSELKYENRHSALTKHECVLWGEVEGIFSVPTREVAEQLYVQHVMCPLLGPDHVDAGIRVPVSREFLEAVESKVLCLRPSGRVDAAKINSQCDSVLLIADHSVFPHDFFEGLINDEENCLWLLYCLNRYYWVLQRAQSCLIYCATEDDPSSMRVTGYFKEDFCVSIEIKPKCGFLPDSEFILDQNAAKRSVTRFRMHQSLKLHQGKISQISKYDPLDLFSGSKDRVQKAIKSLFLTPQNNFRVFLNGALVFGGMDDTADSKSFSADQVLDDALRRIILAKDGLHTKYFLELIAEAAYNSGLLNRLLEIQKLDVYDIEGAIHAYYDIVSQPCLACQGKGENKVSGRYSSVHSMPRDESLKIVRKYLISATAKDLSMMISFRSREKANQDSSNSVVFLESTNQYYDYKASFIDLDMKPLKKMEYYYEFDQKIVNCYNQMVKDKKGLDTSI